MTEEIEPIVPMMPHQIRADGGEPVPTSVVRARKTFDDPEDGAPLVPDLS